MMAFEPRYASVHSLRYASSKDTTKCNRTLQLDTPRDPSDVRLMSSDGKPIYISRPLLTMISPVFRDMYDLGSYAPPSPGSTVDEPIVDITLAEDSNTLAILFAYADPTTLNLPSLGINQLFDAMSAAQKYLMEGPLTRLRAALNAPTVICSPSATSSYKPPTKYPIYTPELPQAQQRTTTLLQSAPLPAAVLCSAFGFIPELRIALRELARAHIDMLISNDQECMLPAQLFQYILKQRRVRATWFKIKAKLLFPFAAIASTGDCTQCMRYCAYAVHDTCAKMDDQPNWDTFRSELQKAARCSCGAAAVPVANERFQNDLAKWEAEARIMEAELPVWPPP